MAQPHCIVVRNYMMRLLDDITHENDIYKTIIEMGGDIPKERIARLIDTIRQLEEIAEKAIKL